MPSTVISTIQYDPATGMLRITYTSGVAYDYKNVPEEVYEELKASRAKGVFLNTRIKGNYTYEKVPMLSHY